MDRTSRQRIIVLIMFCVTTMTGNLLLESGSVRDLLQLMGAPAAELAVILLTNTFERRKRKDVQLPEKPE
ncbi:hypothetical protein ACIBCH_13260 [Amycolatopsis thailandensis]|uniref:hypothetical protein n=1 Tax=Amycolatopsis thailandensis TaxID=589330 RepID=UPI0037BB1519